MVWSEESVAAPLALADHVLGTVDWFVRPVLDRLWDRVAAWLSPVVTPTPQTELDVAA